ncbi:hypothetical protein LX36DRAFT_703405 [Colletotrichum falcatum]|nr:hypothetical protein LX36DRAFT_703405 [Colletotrichum falcatum]
MPPTQLLSVCRKYKQDTNSVALWLASTVKACGYPKPLSGLQSHAPEGGRLDGKHKNKAKERPSPGDGKTTRHVIAMKDFLSLADFIVGRRDPAVSVPAGHLQWGVIAARNDAGFM